MGVAGQREVGEIDEGFAAPSGGYLSTARESPDDLCHLDVQEVRGAQHIVDREEALPALLADGGPEQHLHDSGGVDDSHRESRSRRRASVGDSERLGTLLDESLWRSSLRVGRSATACIWIRRKSESDKPSVAARALRRRCRASGTFRIWIIFMLQTYIHVHRMSRNAGAMAGFALEDYHALVPFGRKEFTMPALDPG